ncbi:MAG: hypothetical protein WCD37_14640 [Chloroflexia bacterium]
MPRAGRPPRPGSSFLARFGQLIVSHGIATVPSALFHYQGTLGLTAQEAWFISAVLAHKWTEELPHPNLSRMERETGIPERRLRRYKQRLCEVGFLHVYPRYEESGRQDSNYYDFGPLFEEIERLIAGEPPLRNDIRADERDEPEDSGLAIVRGAHEEAPDHSFVARFGSVIVSRGVAAVPQALFSFEGDLKLTPQQVWFTLYILSVPWSPPYPYPSLLKMAARTGYSKMQLHEIKNSLVANGWLRLVRRVKEDGGQDSNGYDFGPLFDALRRRLQGDHAGLDASPEAVKQGQDAQDAGIQTGKKIRGRPARQGRAGAQKRAQTSTNHQAVNQLTREPVKEHTRMADNGHTWVEVTEVTGESVNRLTREAGARLTEPVRLTPVTSQSKGLRGRRAQGLHKIEAYQTEEEQKRIDSNQPSLIENKQGIQRENSINKEYFSPYIAAIVTDFSDELGDQGHTVSNVSQALRLYREADMDETAFADLLFQARKLVRAYQGKQGLGTINNRMAYFFRVLRDLASRR